MRLAFAALLLLSLPALAQEPTPAPEQPAPPAAPTLSPEDQAAIEAALAEEAAARPREEPKQPPAASPTGFLQSLNPDLALIGNFAAAWFTDPDHLQTGGHDPTARGFNLQSLELTLGAAVDPLFRLDANLAFATSGVEIEEVYATTLGLPWSLQARVGQFLTRFGRHNPTHLHAWEHADQPFALGRIFGSEGNRGLGVELSWLAPTPWFLEVVTSATNAGGEGTARSFYGADDLGLRTPLDLQLTAAVKQFFELGDELSVLWGLSVANGPNPNGWRARTDVYGSDLYLKYRPLRGDDPTILSLQTEWFWRRRQVPGDLLTDVTGYLQALWRFELHWSVAARYEYGSAAWTIAGAQAESADNLDPEWVEARHRVSANTTWSPTEFSRLRLQASMDLPAWRPTPIYAVFLTAEFAIGAHGAHKF